MLRSFRIILFARTSKLKQSISTYVFQIFFTSVSGGKALQNESATVFVKLDSKFVVSVVSLCSAYTKGSSKFFASKYFRSVFGSCFLDVTVFHVDNIWASVKIRPRTKSLFTRDTNSNWRSSENIESKLNVSSHLRLK